MRTTPTYSAGSVPNAVSSSWVDVAINFFTLIVTLENVKSDHFACLSRLLWVYHGCYVAAHAMGSSLALLEIFKFDSKKTLERIAEAVLPHLTGRNEH